MSTPRFSQHLTVTKPMRLTIVVPRSFTLKKTLQHISGVLTKYSKENPTSLGRIRVFQFAGIEYIVSNKVATSFVYLTGETTIRTNRTED